jgi:hypothetical protein
MFSTEILNFIEQWYISVVNLQQMEQALHQEWQNVPENRLNTLLVVHV